MSEEKFFRPQKKTEGRIEERFQTILKRVIRMALYLLFLLIVSYSAYQLYTHLLEDSFFQVREVEIRGCQKIPKETLLSLAGIEGRPNLFSLALKEISERVESHPWVDQVRVQKVFPNRILIQIEERKPMAILQLEEPFYIDSNGVIFSRVGDRDEYNFPFLTGLNRKMLDQDPEGTKHLIGKALEFLKIVDQEKIPPLDGVSEIRMGKISGIHCFTLTDGLEVRMGWDHFEEKIKRLYLIWSDLRKRGVPAALIDCNDLKRMVVKKISHPSNLERR